MPLNGEIFSPGLFQAGAKLSLITEAIQGITQASGLRRCLTAYVFICGGSGARPQELQACRCLGTGSALTDTVVVKYPEVRNV